MNAKFKKTIVKSAAAALFLAAASLAGALTLQTNPVKEELIKNHEGISEETYREILSAADATDDPGELGLGGDGAAAFLLGPSGAAVLGAMIKEYGKFGAEDFRNLGRRVDARKAEIAGEAKGKSDRALALAGAYEELHKLYQTKAKAVRAAELMYDDFKLEKQSRLKYITGQLESFKIEALPADGDSGAMKLRFTNGFKDYALHVRKVKFDMGFYAGDDAKPFFLRKGVLYPFISPVAPGEVREEIVSCGDACQKALTADNSSAKFDILQITGHVPDRIELVNLTKPDAREFEKFDAESFAKEREKRIGAIKEADAALAAAKAKIDKLLEGD